MPEQRALGNRRRSFQARSAGILALTGTALTIVSNVLQQRADIPRGDPLGVLGHMAARPAWFAAALAGVLGMLCWAMAFALLGSALPEPVSRTVARMAEPVLVVAVALFAVNYAHDGFTGGVLARRWASGELDGGAAVIDGRVVEGLVGGTAILSQVLLGLALALYALAMLCSGQYSRVLSWSGLVGTIGWFLGGTALFLRLPGASFEFLLPSVVLAMVWVLGVGVTLIRRSSSGPPAEPR